MAFIDACIAFLGRLLKWEEELPPEPVTAPQEPIPAVPAPLPPNSPPMSPEPIITPPQVSDLLWDTQKHAYHSVRVLCDDAGLTVDQKNLICACIYQESEFLNNARCENKNAAGVVTSVDVGIVQVNSYFHTGPGKDFPSAQYVIDHPQEAVSWMISMYKHGLLKQWVSYSSGAYHRWLAAGSAMWNLAQ